MKLMIAIQILILECVLSLPLMAKSRDPIGTIKEVHGAPDILRHPNPVLSEDLKKRSQSEDFDIALFKNKYWESTKLKDGSRIFYGDVLSSGPKSKMVLILDDGFKLVLNKNSKIRLTKFYMKKKRSQDNKSWVELLSGKLRASIKDSKPKTKFRTRSMAMGVRGTDFVISNLNNKTQLVTIEGEVSAKNISPQEAAVFDELASIKEETAPPQKIETLVDELESLETQEEIQVNKGQFVEAKELPLPEELEKLPEAEKTQLLASSQINPPKPVNMQVVDSIKTLAKDLKTAEDDQAKAAMVELVTEAKEREPEAEMSFNHMLNLDFGIGSSSLTTKNFGGIEHSFSLIEYSHINIAYNYNDWLSFNVSVARAAWDMDDWFQVFQGNNFEGSRDITMLSLGLGLWHTRGPFRLGGKVQLVSDIKPPVAISSDTSRIKMDATFSGGLYLGVRGEWNFTGRWNLFGELGTILGRTLDGHIITEDKVNNEIQVLPTKKDSVNQGDLRLGVAVGFY